MEFPFKQLFQMISPMERYTLVDVGAMGGLEPEWNRVGNFIDTIGFEPDEREYTKIPQKENFRVFNYALADKSNELTLHVSKESGKTSLYKPNLRLLGEFPDSERFAVVDKVRIPAKKVRLLDQVLRENQISDVDFLKIDTQGSELAILTGGQYFLDNRIIGLKIEVEFLEIYCEQPLFLDVDQYMKEHNFDLIDLRRSYWQRKDYMNYRSRGRLIFGDALYFKSIPSFIKSLERNDSKSNHDKILKYVITCLIYGISDHAVFLLNQVREQGLLDDNVCQKYIQIIIQKEKGIKRVLFDLFTLLKPLKQLLRRRLISGPRDWAGGDRSLGDPF